MNVGIGTVAAHSSFSVNICLEFSVLCPCSVYTNPFSLLWHVNRKMLIYHIPILLILVTSWDEQHSDLASTFLYAAPCASNPPPPRPQQCLRRPDGISTTFFRNEVGGFFSPEFYGGGGYLVFSDVKDAGHKGQAASQARASSGPFRHAEDLTNGRRKHAFINVNVQKCKWETAECRPSIITECFFFLSKTYWY
jgi:hypothetical protein